MKKGFWRVRAYGGAAVLIAVAFIIQSASGIVHPLNEEAAEAFFREKSSENYERLIDAKSEELRNINRIILDNPVLNEPNTKKVMDYLIALLQPVYILSIISIGIYLLFFSGTPGGRTRAKNYLMVLILGMAVISVSSQILMLFFGVSKALALEVISRSPADTEAPFIHAADYILEKGVYITSHKGVAEYSWGVERAGIPLLLIPYLALESVILVLKLRFYMVAVLAMALPLTITLYAFPMTRGLGRLLAENTILWTLTQAAMAGVLVIVATGMNLTGHITSFALTEVLTFIMEIAGLFMLMITPFAFVKLFGGFLRT